MYECVLIELRQFVLCSWTNNGEFFPFSKIAARFVHAEVAPENCGDDWPEFGE